jgi:hypothetical protein
MPQPQWPPWWQWDVDCSNPHLAKRMIDRSFNETDLREMLERATAFRPDATPGRFVIESEFNNRRWEVIVEPDTSSKNLIIVTAFPVE